MVKKFLINIKTMKNYKMLMNGNMATALHLYTLHTQRS